MLDTGVATPEDLSAIEKQVETETEAAVRFAEESPFPDPGALYTDITVAE